MKSEILTVYLLGSFFRFQDAFLDGLFSASYRGGSEDRTYQETNVPAKELAGDRYTSQTPSEHQKQFFLFDSLCSLRTGIIRKSEHNLDGL